ncbi:MAG: helix-turn-helix domain-containing protein [Clostridiales bacterium]|nr:helix-turn-helix domain-containing protein [Clostridiales bacterium]
MIQVNQNKMEKLMRAFYTLTGIRIVLFDNGFTEIMSYPAGDCEFCKSMRKNPEFLQKCIDSDNMAFKACKKNNIPIIYVCHAGFTEAVVQLYSEDKIVGYFMFGQIIPHETAKHTRMKLAQICLENGAPDLLETIFTMSGKSEEEIRAAATILESLSVYVWSGRIVTLPRKQFLEILDDYIEDNLDRPITSQDICSYFGFGRTYLYKLASRYLGGSISTYVRRCRIRKACQLLTETEIPITEIAFKTGFCDYNYFSRCFRAEEGVTASHYRKENRRALS